MRSSQAGGFRAVSTEMFGAVNGGQYTGCRILGVRQLVAECGCKLGRLGLEDW